MNRDISIKINSAIQVYIMSLACISIFIDFYGLKGGKTVYITSMVAAVLLLYFLRYLSKRVLAIVLFLIACVLIEIIRLFNLSLRGIIGGLFSYLNGDKLSESLKLNQYFILIGIIISFQIIIIFWWIQKTMIIRDIVVLLIFIFAIVVNSIGYTISNLSASIICFLLVVTLARIVNKLFNNKMYSTELVDTLMPIIIMISIGSFMLPHKDEPIDWSKIKTFFENIAEKGSELLVDLNFYFGKEDKGSTIIFGEENGELGGELNQSSQLFFSLNGTEPEGNGYIVAKINNTYTGSSWLMDESILNYSNEEYTLDYYETIEAFRRSDYDGDISDLVREKYFTIVLGNIRTNTIFNFNRIKEIINDNKQIDCSRTNIEFYKSKGMNDTYKVGYLDINYGNIGVMELLNEIDDFQYDASESDLYKVLSERSDYIYNNYLNLPDNLPERVNNLAMEITKDCTTDYEKAKAIETYLQSYKYTKSPMAMESDDFVDGFLFETKEGYCTYFASSMAVLARCCNIPSRYVEGYLCKFDETNEYGYSVKGTDAHAWAEIYLEGFGWVPFEATSGYTDSRYKPWKGKNENFIIPESNYRPEAENQPNIGKTSIMKTKLNYKEFVYYGIILFVTIFIILLLMVKLTKVYKVKQFEKGSNKDKVQLLLKDIISYYNLVGKKYESTMTPLEYKESIKDIFGCEEKLDTFIDLYIKGRYRENLLSCEEIEKMIELRQEIYIEFKKNIKWYRRLFF